MIKICQVIGKAACKAVGAVGDLIAGMPALLSGNSTFADIIKESLLIFALSATKTKGEAARFLGLNRSQFKNLVKKYNIDEYYENSN